MATFLYTKLSPYAKSQFFGFAHMESFRQSIRYIAEDILGDPTLGNNKVRSLPMQNFGVDGGRVNFGGGTSVYLQAVATQFNFIGLDINIQTPQILRGDRVGFSSSGDVADLRYATYGAAAGTAQGWVMPRAGSLLGIGVSVDCWSFTSSGSFVMEVQKNNALVWQSPSISVTTTGPVSVSTTQTRGTDTFVAGDFIEFFRRNTSGTYGVSVASFLEVIFDD